MRTHASGTPPIRSVPVGSNLAPRVGVGLAIGIIHPSRPGSDSGSSGSNSDVVQVRSMRGTPRPDEETMRGAFHYRSAEGAIAKTTMTTNVSMSC